MREIRVTIRVPIKEFERTRRAIELVRLNLYARRNYRRSAAVLSLVLILLSVI